MSSTWDLLLRRQMAENKVTPHAQKRPEIINTEAQNFSTPLVQALKQMGSQSRISKGDRLLGGPTLPGITPRSR